MKKGTTKPLLFLGVIVAGFAFVSGAIWAVNDGDRIDRLRDMIGR